MPISPTPPTPPSSSNPLQEDEGWSNPYVKMQIGNALGMMDLEMSHFENGDFTQDNINSYKDNLNTILSFAKKLPENQQKEINQLVSSHNVWNLLKDGVKGGDLPQLKDFNGEFNGLINSLLNSYK